MQRIANEGSLILSDQAVFGSETADFINTMSGIIYIEGQVTLNCIRFVNEGTLIFNFSDFNHPPRLKLNSTSNSLHYGNIIVSSFSDYIAAGVYILVHGTQGTTVQIGGFLMPTARRYIPLQPIITINGNGTITLNVDRIGFGVHAQTYRAKFIGNFLEYIGSNGPATAKQITLLNNLENTDTDETLTAELETILLREYDFNVQHIQTLLENENASNLLDPLDYKYFEDILRNGKDRLSRGFRHRLSAKFSGQSNDLIAQTNGLLTQFLSFSEAATLRLVCKDDGYLYDNRNTTPILRREFDRRYGLAKLL